MGNVSTIVCVKFRCTLLRSKKALGTCRELITTTTICGTSQLKSSTLDVFSLTGLSIVNWLNSNNSNSYIIMLIVVHSGPVFQSPVKLTLISDYVISD